MCVIFFEIIVEQRISWFYEQKLRLNDIFGDRT